ncbi:MAG: LCP family protein [Acidimicrobiia bacterium]|nr:LCP family protein [Acidimicrobiia bacterium]
MSIVFPVKRIASLFSGLIICIVTLSLLSIGFLSAVTTGQINLASPKGKLIITARHLQSNRNLAKNSIVLPVRSDVFYLLVIGNDYRPGVEGKRADSLHLLGINPGEKKVSMINFPRDTNVAIPGHGTNKINAANAFGGSELTAQTIEQLTGVSISYTLEADFAGFTSLIDSLGGLEVTVDKEMHDKNSGTDFSPGTIRMGGASALAFSRDRHSFSNGDLQRSQNQGQLLIYALREMQNVKNSTPNKFESAFAITQHIQLKNLSLSDIFFMMELATEINIDNISNITVPWQGSNTLAPRASDLFNDFKDNAIIDTYVP